MGVAGTVGAVVVGGCLFGQSPPALDGASGWAGAGLLGAVLAWLMFAHLPAKDKQLATLFERLDSVVGKKDVQLDEQRKEFTATLAAMLGAFKTESAAERIACEKHFETLAASMNAAFKTLGDQLSSHAQRNQQWLEVLRREVEIRKGAAVPAPDEKGGG